MFGIRADEDQLILHSAYKTVSSIFAEECSFEAAGIKLVIDGIRVVGCRNEVAHITHAFFRNTTELHAALYSRPAPSHDLPDHIPRKEPDQPGGSNRQCHEEPVPRGERSARVGEHHQVSRGKVYRLDLRKISHLSRCPQGVCNLKKVRLRENLAVDLEKFSLPPRSDSQSELTISMTPTQSA